MSEGWVAMQASLVPRNAAVHSLNALILGRGITSTRGRNTAEDKVLRVFCASASVRKSHDEGQCNIETCNVVVVETTYRPAQSALAEQLRACRPLFGSVLASH